MRRTLLAALGAALTLAGTAQAAPTHYVTMTDGAQIALNVKVPEHCLTDPDGCPTYFEMSGYESGSDEGRTPAGHLADQTGIKQIPLQTGTRAAHAARFEDRYVTVLANVRGTGCSSGEFDLFSWRSALDGKEVIDRWIPEQDWSNGDVVLFGHSYSGLTAMFVASTRPEHLRAVSASGLIGDLYRDITYPGGVTNYGFPLLWTAAVRPLYDVGGGTIGGMYPPEETSEQCARNQAGRSRTVLEDPLINGVDDTDSNWFRSRSLVSVVDNIEVPVHITAAYQDEQTGGRGPTNVFDTLNDRISKRLVLVNGRHGTQTEGRIWNDRAAWMDYWLLGRETADLGFQRGEVTLSEVFGPRDTPTETSRVILGYNGGDTSVGDIESDGFPLGQTQVTDLHVTADGLSRAEAADSGTATWVNGSRRQAYAHQTGKNTGGEVTSARGPDEVEFALEFSERTTIAGPVTANLFVSSSAPDTELFVQLIDRAPTGEMLYLTRGMLRGSHRQWNPHPSFSDVFEGWAYRPWRNHDERSLVRPGEVVEYLIDVWPVGHVFMPGHELVVKISAPPADDNDYAYVQKTLPGVNTVHFGPDTPSRLTVPVIPEEAVVGKGDPAGPCAYSAMRCVKPITG